MVKLIEGMLKLSKVKEDEKVVILTTPHYNEELLLDYVTAARNLGADVVRLIWVPPSRKEKGVGPAFEALKGKGLIVRVYSVFPPPDPDFIMYSPGFADILNSGARFLDVMLNQHDTNYRRLFPSEDLIKRTMACAELMEKAKTIRVTSDDGTDLAMTKEGRKGHKQDGVADIPGMWDNFGFGLVACAPKEDSANGTLVMQPGDFIISMDREVTEPVKLTFKDGYATKIEGGMTAKMLKKWLDGWKDQEAYGTSHIGWGTHDKAVWREHGGKLMDIFTVADAESYMGIMQIALGMNTHDTPSKRSGMAGKRVSISHIDLDLLDQNFYLDDELIVQKGKIVHPQCK